MVSRNLGKVKKEDVIASFDDLLLLIERNQADFLLNENMVSNLLLIQNNFYHINKINSKENMDLVRRFSNVFGFMIAKKSEFVQSQDLCDSILLGIKHGVVDHNILKSCSTMIKRNKIYDIQSFSLDLFDLLFKISEELIAETFEVIVDIAKKTQVSKKILQLLENTLDSENPRMRSLSFEGLRNQNASKVFEENCLKIT